MASKTKHELNLTMEELSTILKTLVTMLRANNALTAQNVSDLRALAQRLRLN